MGLLQKLKEKFSLNWFCSSQSFRLTLQIKFGKKGTVMDRQKTNQMKLVFADVFNIRTRTTFKEDGTLVVVPVDWGEGDIRLETPTGKKPPKIYGKMEYSLSGKAMFVPSKVTNKQRYTILHSDQYLQIRETDKDLIFKVQASKGYFTDKRTVKPVIDSLDWAKQFINNDIKARQNHKKNGSKQNLLQGR